MYMSDIAFINLSLLSRHLFGLELASPPQSESQPIDKFHQRADAEAQTETKEPANLPHPVDHSHPLGSLVLKRDDLRSS